MESSCSVSSTGQQACGLRSPVKPQQPAEQSRATPHIHLTAASVPADDKFFGFYGLGPMPDWVHYVCCAQFAVSRDRMRGRPLSFYQAMRAPLVPRS